MGDSSSLGQDVFEHTAGREWWLGNAMGGWASGTVAGARSRKYHGWLVSAKPSIEAPWLLLAKMEETALASGKRVPLSSNYYPDAVHPQGYKQLSRFSFDGAVARWSWQFENRRLSREIWCAHGHQTTYIRYTLMEGDRLGLEVVPLVSGRPVHGIGLPREMQDGRAGGKMGERQVEWRLPVPWSISADDGLFRPARDTYRNFCYPLEKLRGEAACEDLRSPGRFELLLHEGHHITFTASAEGPDPHPMEEAEVADHRIERLVEQFRTYNHLPPMPAMEGLVRAADAFVIRDGKRHNIIAGYPYFGRWCRDAMISLPGLCIYTGRHSLARDIIENWMAYLHEGMLPTRIDERGRARFESADGMLWMMRAIGMLEEEGGLAADTLARWWNPIRSALRSRLASEEQTYADTDGLLALTNPRGTWMDAEVGGKPVVSRAGKRVEINALWVHALQLGAKWAAHLRDKLSERLFDEAAQTSREGMRQFYNEYANYLDDGIEPTDGALRPNQLIALSLPDIGLSSMQQRNALAAVKESLLIPGRGLRTLDAKDPRYQGKFGGSQGERDLAYHNGAVWPWLLGAYVDACLLCYPHRPEEARRALLGLPKAEEPGAILGLPEVYDPTSGAAGGCPLQAWSVGEVLRAHVKVERMRHQGAGRIGLAMQQRHQL